MPVAGQDRIERGRELACAGADKEPEGDGTVVEAHQQVAGLLGGPGLQSDGWCEELHVAAADLHGEEDADSFQGHRAVDVEEDHGQQGRGLHAQEPVGFQNSAARADLPFRQHVRTR
jgi:hypothetical protein